MAENRLTQGAKVTIDRDGLQALVDALAARGYQVIGPTVRDGAIVYDTCATIADLPAGWTDQQEAGRYRLERRDDQALFGYAVGPQSWKRFLHPPIERCGRRSEEDGLSLQTAQEGAAEIRLYRRARLRNARDRHPGSSVLSRGRIVDTGYRERRQDISSSP